MSRRQSSRVKPNFGYRVPTGSTQVNSAWAGALRGQESFQAESTRQNAASVKGPATLPASLKVFDAPLHFCPAEDLQLLVTEITRLRIENEELVNIKQENAELRARYNEMSEYHLKGKLSRMDKLGRAFLQMRDADERTLWTMCFNKWAFLTREHKASRELEKAEAKRLHDRLEHDKAIQDLDRRRSAIQDAADAQQDKAKMKAMMAFSSKLDKGGVRNIFHAWKTLWIA